MKRILVIDDDNAVRAAICENLRELGFDVTESSNGTQGMAMIDLMGIPDLIITDIVMPQMNGIEVISKIRDRQPDAKIIAISGGGRRDVEDFLETARKTGASAVFAKPLDIDFLESEIHRLVP